MILLKLTNSDEDIIGSINWFSVHPVSMMDNDSLISEDNKETASCFLEREYDGKDTLPGEETIVYALANSNLGDTSPNIFGTFCTNTELPFNRN